jgi:hypothetical protein
MRVSDLQKSEHAYRLRLTQSYQLTSKTSIFQAEGTCPTTLENLLRVKRTFVEFESRYQATAGEDCNRLRRSNVSYEKCVKQ